jgi:hypothetical protein
VRREKEEFFRINRLRENPKTELRELNVDFGDRQNAARLRGLRPALQVYCERHD